jgi:ribosomal protein S18 acetylase RimI-like enzyme
VAPHERQRRREIVTDRNLILRPAVEADTRAIAAIWRHGWHDAHDGRIPEALAIARTDRSFESRAVDRMAATVVASVGGEVVGFVTVVEDEVEQIYVAAGHRGSGAAGMLLAEAESRVAHSGYAHAWLAVVADNDRARRFYARQGWIDAGPLDYPAASDDGQIVVPARRYTKSVSAPSGA